MAMMDDLAQAVSRSAELTPTKSIAAVEAMLRFLGAHLPSPLFGELQAHLQSGTAGATGGAVIPKSET